MVEAARCQCGAVPRVGNVEGMMGASPCVHCGRCGITGPGRPTEPEAIAAWNALMRPRPVARWGEWLDSNDLCLGNVSLGGVIYDDQESCWRAVCAIDDTPSPPMPDEPSARAWLEERVRAQGVDVRKETPRC